MRQLTLLALVLAFTACGKSTDSGGGGSTTADSSGFEKLKVDVAGKPVAMTKAFIKRLPVEGRYQLFLTDTGGNCGELIDNVFNRMSDNALLFDVSPRLQADNKSFKTEVTYVHLGPGSAAIKPGSSVVIKGNADRDTKVEVTVDVDMTVTGGKRPGAIGIHGTFTAEGCGERDASTGPGIPKAQHPSTATMTVAGKKLPIVSAIFKGPKPPPVDGVEQQRELLLSTGPKDCSGSTPWAAFRLEGARSWKLSGEYLERGRSNSSMIDKDGQPETKGLTVTLGAKGDSADGPTIQINLAGAGTIDGIPVELAGTVEALDCPAP